MKILWGIIGAVLMYNALVHNWKSKVIGFLKKAAVARAKQKEFHTKMRFGAYRGEFFKEFRSCLKDEVCVAEFWRILLMIPVLALALWCWWDTHFVRHSGWIARLSSDVGVLVVGAIIITNIIFICKFVEIADKKATKAVEAMIEANNGAADAARAATARVVAGATAPANSTPPAPTPNPTPPVVTTNPGTTPPAPAGTNSTATRRVFNTRPQH